MRVDPSPDQPAPPAGLATRPDAPPVAPMMGARHVVFFVIAAAAPLGFAVGSVPLAIGRGGIGTAGMFLVVGAFLAVFAVGYVAMSRFVPSAGALFSYVAVGLGRPLGLGTAFVAVLAYSISAAGAFGPFSVFAAQAMESLFGITTPWQWWAFGGVALMGGLGVLNVELNVRVLGIIMMVEVAVLVVLAAGIVVAGGAEGLTLDALRPDAIAGGEIGVVLLVVFAAFAGFEATALFRDEVREPDVAIRRAAFASIALIAVFQAVITWAIVQAFGSHAVDTASRQPTEMYALAARRFVGPWLADVLVILVVSSWFASILAFHNAAARYLHALGRDHAIPAAFAWRSRATGAPWVASVAHTIFSVTALIACVVFGFDPYLDLFVVGSVPVAVSIPAMEGLTALAILVFFWRDRRGQSAWSVVVAPAISAVALFVVLWLVLVNIPFFTARSGAVNWILPGINLVALAIGIARALWMRRALPERYALVGRGGAP